MRYKTGYCFTTKELFDNFDPSCVNIPGRVKGGYKLDSKKEFIASVLQYCLYLIILDIIENNVTFVLPLFGNQEACFYVKSFDEIHFKRMRQKGMFRGIDFLESGFKGYQLYFQYTYKGGIREKPIYISNNIKNKFYSNINSGKQYY